MRKNRKITLYKVGMLLLILVLCLSLGNYLGFSQDKVQSKFSEFANKFGSFFNASDFTFEFIYLSDTLTNYMREEGIEFPSKNDESKELMRNIGDKRGYFLTATASEIASFNPGRFVFVQSGQQFNIRTLKVSGPDFYVFQGEILARVYPGVLIRGVLLLPSSFNPTIPATIWYDEKRLGDFVINAEHRGLLSILRKPVKTVGYLDFEKEADGTFIIALGLEDKYGLSTKSDGLINCQIYSLKYNFEEEHYEESELLYEKEIDIRANDFRLDYSFREEEEEKKIFIYRWQGKLVEEEPSKPPIDIKGASSGTLAAYLWEEEAVARLIISFTLSAGERLIATMDISRSNFRKLVE